LTSRALIVVVCALGTAWTLGTSPGRRAADSKVAAGPPREVLVEDLRSVTAYSPEELTDAVDRGPFHPERRRPRIRFDGDPDPIPQLVRVPTRSNAPVRLRFLGSVTGVERPFAVLEEPGQAARVLRQGDSIGEYRILSIARAAVSLAAGDSTFTLALEPGRGRQD
jgi:Tfp pilus assembly protein PilP